MSELNQNQDAIIEIRHLQKTFGDHEVLSDINLSVRRGEVVSIIGSAASTCWRRRAAARSSSTARTLPPAMSICANTAPRSAWCFSSSTCSTT